MAKLAVFISDLHLEADKLLWCFDSYDEFDRFLNGVLDQNYPDDDIDLVLLGDTFDFWSVVPQSNIPQGMNSPNVWDLQKTIKVELDIEAEQQKIQEIAQWNKPIFKSLGKFLNARQNRKVFLIPGNHDHSMVAGKVQRKLENIIRGFGIDKSQLIHSLYYENPELQVYAEHGNQFDKDNLYKNFSKFSEGEATYLEDCRGYFFVQLFWNILESSYPKVGKGPTRWYLVFAWLLKNSPWEMLPFALRLFYFVYNNYPKDFERVSILESCINALAIECEGREMEMLLMFPENLFKNEFDRDCVFSYDNTVEEFYRKLYHAPGEEGSFTRAVLDEIFKAKSEKLRCQCFIPKPRDPSPNLKKELAQITYPEHVALSPEDFAPYIPGAARGIVVRYRSKVAAKKLLTPGNFVNLKGKPLDPQIRHIVFGHTHEAIKEYLPGQALYFNTGTWQSWQDEMGKRKKDLRYVLIHNKKGSITADLHQL